MRRFSCGHSDRVSEHYDVIIIGTGAGGGTLAHTLAPSGKKILLLERGDFLPRETDNWEPGPVFVDGKYISPDTWYGANGKPFQPQVHYYVGGATKMYGAALYRLRPADFGEIQHVDGPSPAWPLGYDDFELWYTKAEWTSVLDLDCKAHELDNLYVVDTSFFPSIGAVNPALTAMANAIRVGEHLLTRLH